MSLLDTASLIVTPNGYKEGKLYSVIPSDGSGDLSVVRATTATRVNSAGLVELVPYNLLTYSEQFDNADWGKEFTTITANNITAPNGTATADRLNLGSGTEQKFIYQAESQNGTYTQSVYLKKGTHTFFQLAVGGDVNPYCNFDLTNGTYSAFGSTATITNVSDGWYRCTMTYTTTTGTYVYIFAVDSLSSARTASTSSTGNYYVWGAQLVEGSTAKDYQKTETRLNIPRLDYSNGTCPSLLVEPQRTNRLTYSSSFDNAAWTIFNCIVTANSVISPSGIQDGDTLTSTNSGAGFYQALSVASGVYTISVYAKKGTKNWMSFVDVAGANYRCWFNLDTGTLGTVTNGTATIEDAGNGWWRCTYTSSTSLSGNYYQLAIAETDNSVTLTSNGTIFVWGAQMEVGSYATSYIPTTSASVTRNADVISKTGISSLIGQTEGTIFGEFEVLPQKNDSMLCLIRDLAGGLYGDFFFIRASLGVPAVSVRQGDTTYVAINGATALSEGYHKFAFAYKQNDFAFYVDGQLIGTDTSGNVPTCNEIYLGQYVDGFDREVSKKSFALWKTRLTNTQLSQLTSI